MKKLIIKCKGSKTNFSQLKLTGFEPFCNFHKELIFKYIYAKSSSNLLATDSMIILPSSHKDLLETVSLFLCVLLIKNLFIAQEIEHPDFTRDGKGSNPLALTNINQRYYSKA